MPERPMTLAEPTPATRAASEPAAPPAVTALHWRLHPAAEQPLRSVAVLAAITLAAALVAAVTGSGAGALLAGVALLGSLRAWFLPRTYALDDDGAHERGPLQAPRSLPWSDVRTVSRERHGVHLSPLHRPARWAPDRGIFLRTGERAARADEVAARVAEFMRRRQPA